MDQRPAEGHRLKGQQYSRVCGSRLRKDSRSRGKDIQEVTRTRHPSILTVFCCDIYKGGRRPAEMRQRVGQSHGNCAYRRTGGTSGFSGSFLLHNAQDHKSTAFVRILSAIHFHVIDLDRMFRVADDSRDQDHDTREGLRTFGGVAMSGLQMRR